MTADDKETADLMEGEVELRATNYLEATSEDEETTTEEVDVKLRGVTNDADSEAAVDEEEVELRVEAAPDEEEVELKVTANFEVTTEEDLKASTELEL